ncbi:MAG: hypothetical protein HC912_03185 [Saprospiraceae bacterium]|nr:hypothetical protein [Saprospiraceae bacterium]
MPNPEEKENKRNFKLKVWQMILLPIVLALIPLLYPEVKALFARKQPRFIIENPIISYGDSVVYIYAENAVAKKREPLNIVVEGLKFKDAAKLVKTSPELEWEFLFTAYGIPETLFSEGLNTIEIGFSSSTSYDKLNVYVRPDFYQKHPVATTDLTPRLLDSVETDVYVATVTSAAMDDDNRVGITESALRGMGVKAYAFKDVVHDKRAAENTKIYYYSQEASQKVDSIKHCCTET